MTDKSWLLNPQAIQAARQCIRAVEQELGVKLKLSHPDFLSLLQDYCDLTESQALHRAWQQLQLHREIQTVAQATNNVLPLTQLEKTTPNNAIYSGETVSINGHQYPKYNEQGETFKGVYRGQPSYG